jgi:hypothetical protein
MGRSPQFKIPVPQLQIDFSQVLTEIRALMLQEALGRAVREIELIKVDAELAECAPDAALSIMAAKGLRGELVFAVPSVLEYNPRLLGYYRLLLGYSQKQFYTTETGLSRFKSLEEKGRLSEANRSFLKPLCLKLNLAGAALLAGLGDIFLNQANATRINSSHIGPSTQRRQ